MWLWVQNYPDQLLDYINVHMYAHLDPLFHPQIFYYNYYILSYIHHPCIPPSVLASKFSSNCMEQTDIDL